MAVRLMPERDCGKCTAMRKEQWGCTKDAPLPLMFDGKETRRCPRRPLLDQPDLYTRAFSAYGSYMSGYLPDDGGTADQSHLFTRVMEIVGRANADADAEVERKRELELERQRRGNRR